MKNIFVASFFAFVFFCVDSFASDNNVCQKVLLIKKPGAVLIDANNSISSGPIDFGKIAVSSNLTEENKRFESEYKVLVFPHTLLKHEEIPMGLTAILTKTKTICPKTLMYKVSLLGDFKVGQIRPYKFSTELTWFTRIGGAGYEEDLPNLYREFDARVIGIFVEPEKK